MTKIETIAKELISLLCGLPFFTVTECTEEEKLRNVTVQGILHGKVSFTTISFNNDERAYLGYSLTSRRGYVFLFFSLPKKNEAVQIEPEFMFVFNASNFSAKWRTDILIPEDAYYHRPTFKEDMLKHMFYEVGKIKQMYNLKLSEVTFSNEKDLDFSSIAKLFVSFPKKILQKTLHMTLSDN